MKTVLRKFLFVTCLTGFALALVTPAQARRIIVVTTDPKPLVSLP